jgi:hypothetical protein
MEEVMPEVIKPKLNVEGLDGNIFAVIGAVRQVLRRAGQHQAAEEVGTKVRECKSYDEALAMAFSYVDVTFGDSYEDEDDEDSEDEE